MRASGESWQTWRWGRGEALRVEDVQRLLHLSRNTVYKLARTGELPSWRVGRQIRFRREDVMARAAAGDGVRGVPAPASPAGGGRARPAGGGPEGGLPLEGAASLELMEARPDVLDELPAWMQGSLVLGGQDMAGDVLANYLAGVGVRVVRSHANGYVTLARMYLGTAHASIASLWSGEEERYNIPYVRAMLPGMPLVVVRLYRKRVGFTFARRGGVRPGSWGDLLAPEVRVANRERGADARVLLDERLAYLEADPTTLAGYDRVVTSEFAQALLVARGAANVAVTGERPSRQMAGLDFLPMQTATVDLVVVRSDATRPLLKAARSLLRTEAFRGEFDPTLYDTSGMGDVVFEA